MSNRALSIETIRDIQDLYTCRVPKAQIAKFYNTSPALIAYHTRFLPQHDLETLLETARTLNHPVGRPVEFANQA